MIPDGMVRLLCVDDEQNVLDALARTLRNLYSVETALGGVQGLEILRANGPFAVVMSDQRMPGMSGVEFLSVVRQAAPDSVRVLLTGYADLNDTIAAVNDGHIFRFLVKPCPSDVLCNSLAACAEQYRLVTSERVLLEQTLRGSIKALTDVLSLANPAAFGRATRVQHLASELAAHFDVQERWPIEVAAMLSQIGYVTLPPDVQEKVYKDEDLADSEKAMRDRVPQVAERLLANIPRLDPVREILRYHTAPFAGKHVSGSLTGEAIPWGARALKIALDFDTLESNHKSNHSFDILRSRAGWYDPAILEAFAELRGRQKQEVKSCELHLKQVEVGMIFGEDVRSTKGLLMIARGQEVTPNLLERVRNFSSALKIREPIQMLVREATSSAAQEALTVK